MPMLQSAEGGTGYPAGLLGRHSDVHPLPDATCNLKAGEERQGRTVPGW